MNQRISPGYRGAGYVVAPAGFGKTHLIARATRLSAGRQLILTHTYAGVNSLKRKMQVLGVAEKLFRIDTIASWALRLCLAYSHTSEWVTERPEGDEWGTLYVACDRLIEQGFIRRIVRASYAGIYVDEYQDCSVEQHNLVLKLARDLPCRVLGDPLQGIFDFEGQNPIDWVRDVGGNFEQLGILRVPHRWINADAGELGEWLRRAREQLEEGRPIDLGAAKPQSVSVRVVRNNAPPHLVQAAQGNACRGIGAAAGHTVVAIHKGSGDYKARCHALSRHLGGMYSSIEEVEGKGVFAFLREIEEARRPETRLRRAIGFAAKCLTKVNDVVPASVRNGEATAIRANTRNPKIARLANAYLADVRSNSLAALLKEIRRAPDVGPDPGRPVQQGVGGTAHARYAPEYDAAGSRRTISARIPP